MFCLLCHEKIPRLRAWRTKSEFCCDEHAELYKRQTLERLLTDQDHGKTSEALPLPLNGPATDLPVEEVVASRVPAPAGRRQEALPPIASDLHSHSEPGEPEGAQRDEGLQELWRLAEEVGQPLGDDSDEDWGLGQATPRDDFSGRFSDFGDGEEDAASGGVKSQTAEEALAALRELAGGRGAKEAALDDSGDELDTLLSARGFHEPTAPREVSAAEPETPAPLDETRDEEALSDDEPLFSLDDGSLEPLDDDELPSILERLTGQEPASVEPAHFEPAAVEAEAEEAFEEPLGELDTTPSLVARLNDEPQQAAAAEAVEPDAEDEILEPVAAADKAAAADLLEAAIESHLEESQARSGKRDGSPKVVPFPLARPVAPGSETEKVKPAAEWGDAGAGLGLRAVSLKTGKGPRAAKAASDARRLQLRPVAVMFGIEPSLYQPVEDAGELAAATFFMQSVGDAVGEPPISYPDLPAAGRSATFLTPYNRLWMVLPQVPEPPAAEGSAGQPNLPDYAAPCEAPGPLALWGNGKPRKPSVGSERAWMFSIEPALSEAAGLDLGLPNGDQHSPYRRPQLPPALLSDVVRSNGSGKLDLSGPAGSYQPPVDRVCLVLPNLSELPGANGRRGSGHGTAEEIGRWLPPTVLDPRFDIEKPAGRELSDFG